MSNKFPPLLLISGRNIRFGHKIKKAVFNKTKRRREKNPKTPSWKKTKNAVVKKTQKRSREKKIQKRRREKKNPKTPSWKKIQKRESSIKSNFNKIKNASLQ